jgi:hypothetical protein
MRLIKKFSFFSGIFFLVVACVGKDIDLSDKEYAGLKNSIQRYYDLEKGKKWSETYVMRTPSFRRVVGKDTYISTMEEQSKGWELLEFSILSAAKNGKKEIVVKMKVLESFPKDSDFGRALGGRVDKNYFTDHSVWKEIDGQWYCKAAGARAHLSLNHALEE